ncbi:MFS transporter [Rhodococcus hoagii]|nr:MFS transporter [Prescottella equi]
MSETSQEDPADTTTTSPPRELAPRLAVITLCAAGIVVSLMQSIIMPLIPQLPSILNSSPDSTTWAVTITLLTGAAVTPISGRLGDMYGKRLVLLVNMGLVAAGSLVCAGSSSLAPFLAGRALQGLGFGTIALGISVMRDIVPPRHLGSSIGAMSASLGIGGALGLPFAAVIAAQINWQTMFLACAAVALAAGLGIASTIPESPTRTGGRFDIVGAVGLVTMLSCLLLPLSKGATWGWATPLTLGLFTAFAFLAIGWSAFERRRSSPLIDLSVATERSVLLTNIASFATGFAFYSVQLIPIQLLMAPTASPNGMGLDMVSASLVLAPSGLIMFAFSRVSAQITDKFGPRISLATGGMVLAAGYIVLLGALTGPWNVGWPAMLIVSCFIGAGLGIAYSAMPALIMRAVRPEQTGEANGVNALMRVVGTSASSATVGMILTWSTINVATSDGGVTLPSQSGYLWAGAISLVACIVAAAVALMIPTRRAPASMAPASRVDS